MRMMMMMMMMMMMNDGGLFHLKTICLILQYFANSPCAHNRGGHLPPSCIMRSWVRDPVMLPTLDMEQQKSIASPEISNPPSNMSSSEISYVNEIEWALQGENHQIEMVAFPANHAWLSSVGQVAM